MSSYQFSTVKLNPKLLSEVLLMQLELLSKNPFNETKYFSLSEIKDDFQAFLQDKGDVGYLAPMRINDMRYINRFLEETNEKLNEGERFAGFFQTFNAHRKERWINRIPVLRQLYFGAEFLLKRVIPKIKYVNNVYFALNGGRNRLLSKAEVLGRLVCCGFEIETVENKNHMTYFIVRKVAKPLYIENKNYGLLFKMKRVGKNGKLFYVYKLRTMHPFSEFLQDYMIRQHGFASTGKVENDFRLTPWGRVLRRYWLDELPQMLNLLKGDMKLIGVRPVSAAYYNMMPEDLQQDRIKFKPGLIPPYVALNFESSVEKVLEAERIYLMDKKARPYSTDMRYFFWSMFNIIWRKKRSN